MKHKNADLVVSILWAVMGIILTGIVIYYIMIFVNGTTNAADHFVRTSDEIVNSYTDYDITMYDSEEVRGSEVVNFIKKVLGDYSSSEIAPVYVKVITTSSGITYTNQYVNKVHLTDVKNFSNAQYYIIPTGMFLCEVIKSANKAILGVKFSQK